MYALACYSFLLGIPAFAPQQGSSVDDRRIIGRCGTKPDPGRIYYIIAKARKNNDLLRRKMGTSWGGSLVVCFIVVVVAMVVYYECVVLLCMKDSAMSW